MLLVQLSPTRLCVFLVFFNSLLLSIEGFTTTTSRPRRTSPTSSRNEQSLVHHPGTSLRFQATELPDSLDDSAIQAAEATAAFVEQSGGLARCRVDFDTSIGDETFSILKTSTEFMQKYVTALCYATMPDLQKEKQNELMRLAEARAELRTLQNGNEDLESDAYQERMAELEKVIAFEGRDEAYIYTGPVARIYFPDEGNAALARRDWLGESPKVPPCVEFSSCGGVQLKDTSNDRLIFFFCPRATEAEFVEKILFNTEENAPNLLASVFCNPNLVDMGVTGFGMAGRMLRERLLDTLQQVYYLRTLQWGALTRLWPYAYSVWQEDENSEGGYRLIKTMDRLPSNPEVEDIYDIENGSKSPQETPGFLNQ